MPFSHNVRDVFIVATRPFSATEAGPAVTGKGKLLPTLCAVLITRLAVAAMDIEKEET